MTRGSSVTRLILGSLGTVVLYVFMASKMNNFPQWKGILYEFSACWKLTSRVLGFSSNGPLRCFNLLPLETVGVPKLTMDRSPSARHVPPPPPRQASPYITLEGMIAGALLAVIAAALVGNRSSGVG